MLGFFFATGGNFRTLHWNDTEKIHPKLLRDRGPIPRAFTKGKQLFFSNVSKILPAEGIRGPRRGVIHPLWVACNLLPRWDTSSEAANFFGQAKYFFNLSEVPLGGLRWA